MKKLLFLIPLLFCSTVYATPSITTTESFSISGDNFGSKTNNGEGRSQLCWIWDNGEDYETFTSAGWTSSQCVPNDAVITEADLTYSTSLTANQVHSNSIKYITGSHSASGFTTGGTVSLFCGGDTTFTKYYARWYYYEESPFTYETTGVKGQWDMRNNKNFTVQDRDSLYAGDGTGISYSYVDNNGLVVYTDDWTQIWGVDGDWSRTIHANGFGTFSGTKSGAIPNNGEAGHWELWEVQGFGSDNSNCELKVYINGVLKINIISSDFPFDIKGIGIGGYRDKADNINFRKYFDDVYIDKEWSRIVVSNNSVLSNSTVNEIQIPTSWSDTEISVTWNQGSFADYETCYLFVIDADGNASSGYEGYFIDGTFISGDVQNDLQLGGQTLNLNGQTLEFT